MLIRVGVKEMLLFIAPLDSGVRRTRFWAGMGEQKNIQRKQGNSEVAITITWSTILKLAVACLLGYAAVRLWRFEELLLVAVIIAIAFRPLVQWMANRRWPRWIGVLASAMILFGTTAGLIGILIPTIGNEGVGFVKKLPEFKEQLQQRLPRSGPVRHIADKLLGAEAFSNPEPIVKQLLAWSGVALEHLAEFFIVLILAIYFVADGARVYRWVVAFLPERQRVNAATAADEITSVIGRYVVGNLITSVLAAAYAFTVLQVLHVPNAALLAVLAGVFDLLPIIGFFLFIFPAALLALTVSATAALLVVLLYGAYHLAENYFIVPKVYGNRLRLSTLTVLIACLAAGLLAGVVGVLIALPLVACYPVVERVWLRPHLQRHTVKEHERIDAKEHS
jgi:predicted PurR-regulated permease PerM